ncbi:tail fiber domain-containing protein [Dyadobacter sp.]|uniref:tail fiber domain-containing protein n=1 Tax=Dyadobacter sp. TaxID=1914288 RepID=UPI003F6F9C60
MKAIHNQVFLVIAVLLSILPFSIYAQVPQQFSFQGVARDAAGKVIPNRNVSLRISVRPTTALGSPVYQETHATQTSANGIFNISVGAGLVQSGQFADIKWNSDKFFLQIELDPDGGSNYINLGATQLLSVPYALHAEEAGRLKDFDPIVQEGHWGKGAYLTELNWDNHQKMMWYPRRAAFRFGSWSKDDYKWTDANIGDASFAGGVNSLAEGDRSFAFGTNVKALGAYSVLLANGGEAEFQSIGMGSSVQALGDNSIAIGGNIKSLGSHSAAIGYNLRSNSKYGISFGLSNDISDAVDNDLKPTHRLFQIGNGDEDPDGARRNALTVLRNGNVGIGNNALRPTHILDVGHRMRLRSNPGYTAGLWLDDAGGAQYCFIGGYNDDRAGFYFDEGGWRFTVDRNGSAFLSGTLTQNSDLRLKRDIIPLTANFEKLASISGRHYYWKDPQRSQGLQTGLIAQEVESVFPELVETDKDGFKSVNYIGLIPHLLEAVKELKRENARLGSENKKLASDTTKMADLQKRIEAIEASLVHSQATSSN